MKSATNPIHIRWLIRRDLDRVLQIERASFRNPWTENELVADLRGKSTVGIVVEIRDALAAFAIYDLAPAGILLLKLAVDPAYRKRGVGRRILCHLIRKLNGRRRTLRAYVSERNLGAQLFFQRCGFLATSIERGTYGEPDHDAYVMDLTVAAFGGRFTSTMKGS